MYVDFSAMRSRKGERLLQCSLQSCGVHLAPAILRCPADKMNTLSPGTYALLRRCMPNGRGILVGHLSEATGEGGRHRGSVTSRIAVATFGLQGQGTRNKRWHMVTPQDFGGAE